MRIFEIVSQAKSFLLLGGCVAIAALLLFLLGYYIFYKKIGKGKKRIQKDRLVVIGLFLCYLTLVVGVTMLNRVGGHTSNLNLQLFSSYKEAWNSFSEVEWRNIILNILLFVPMGIVLPVVFKRINSFWRVSLTGLAIAVCIELVQFIKKIGITELDDVVNNTLGTMIGYGLFALAVWVVRKKQKEENCSIAKVALSQLPLLVTVLGFLSMFLIYTHQEFGNLEAAYSYKVPMKEVSVSAENKLKKEPQTMNVYQAKVASIEECVSYANELLKQVGTTVDESKNDVYQDTLVCRSMDENYIVWVDYKGMTTSVTNFTQISEESDPGYSEKEVRQILEQSGIVIPTQATFEVDEFGTYLFTISMEETDTGILDGTICCMITKDGVLQEYENKLISYQTVRAVEVKSEQEVFDEVKEGHFNLGHVSNNLKSIVIRHIDHIYMLDSKGYYQPVYQVTVIINGQEDELYIPAMKK